MNRTKILRREFLQASGVAGAVAYATRASLAADDTAGQPQFVEWRVYQLLQAQQPQLLDYLGNAALPAWQRLGIGPVGVFTETGASATAAVHVLLTYQTAEQFAHARAELEQDTGYQSAAMDYLALPQKTPAFDRIESSLMVTFAAMPYVSPPSKTPRVFELREYQSHSEGKARRKIEMFNSGEIPIFRSVGFETVFFGETLIGPRLPNLKYMLASESLEANQQSWQQFREHPDWVAMKDLPQYAETVSKVVQTYLVPTEFSQV